MESAALTFCSILAAVLLYRAGYRSGFETGVDAVTELLFKVPRPSIPQAGRSEIKTSESIG
ncbi:hypothetical protein JQ604_33965 [Bradyrhizobium jicamae]|uniref:hypothetical protein n=1 Tax=Bradyrhizobium jicamae TaxID=280332 RepID=UPI001BABF8DF|nr:hypothetical protein [Bradyrhizobium jicamae]MBR0757212.1 hypothetical protein [Bradyrhizobium jicamae]